LSIEKEPTAAHLDIIPAEIDEMHIGLIGGIGPAATDFYYGG
jgi:hypothetical protein